MSIKKIKKKIEGNEKKIVEDEDEDEDETNLKIIDESVFNDLNKSCQKIILKAENDNPSSLFLVAKSFIEELNDFPKDIDTGLKYLEYGIQNKNVEIMEYYGKLLFEGEFITKNEEKAVIILTEAVNDFNSSNAKW